MKHQKCVTYVLLLTHMEKIHMCSNNKAGIYCCQVKTEITALLLLSISV